MEVRPFYQRRRSGSHRRPASAPLSSSISRPNACAEALLRLTENLLRARHSAGGAARAPCSGPIPRTPLVSARLRADGAIRNSRRSAGRSAGRPRTGDVGTAAPRRDGYRGDSAGHQPDASRPRSRPPTPGEAPHEAAAEGVPRGPVPWHKEGDADRSVHSDVVLIEAWTLEFGAGLGVRRARPARANRSCWTRSAALGARADTSLVRKRPSAGGVNVTVELPAGHGAHTCWRLWVLQGDRGCRWSSAGFGARGRRQPAPSATITVSAGLLREPEATSGRDPRPA
jgi:hypothetical protein